MDKKTHIEWRVETTGVEDDFGTDEQEARDWLVRAKAEGWPRPRLLSRIVTIEASPWAKVK